MKHKFEDFSFNPTDGKPTVICFHCGLVCVDGSDYHKMVEDIECTPISTVSPFSIYRGDRLVGHSYTIYGALETASNYTQSMQDENIISILDGNDNEVEI